MTGEAGGGLRALRERADHLAGEGRWQELARVLGQDPDALLDHGRLAYRYGQALYHTGRLTDLSAFATRFEARARDERDVGSVLRALNLAGIASFELGRTPEAKRRFERLLELAEAEGDPDMSARAANNLGLIANLRGRHREAISYYELAAPLYQRLERTRGLAQLKHNLAISYRDMDRIEDSAESYRAAASLADEAGYDFLVGMARVGRGEIELRRGDAELAAALAERGLEIARRVGDPVSEAEALRVRGGIRVAEGDLDGAEDDLDTALELAVPPGSSLVVAEVERDLGQLHQRRGDTAVARRFLDRAADRFGEIGAVRDERAARRRIREMSND